MDIPLNILGILITGAYLIFSISIFVFLLIHCTPKRLLESLLSQIFYSKPQKKVKPGTMLDMGDMKWFILVIALALIYSCGLSTEFLSDKLKDHAKNLDVMKILGIPFSPSPSDNAILAQTFKIVYADEKEAVFPNEVHIARKIKKYLKDNEGINSSKLFKEEWAKADLKYVKNKYYDNKNTVYLIPSYFHELTEINIQIKFLRALTFITALLFHSILIGLILSILPHTFTLMPNLKKRKDKSENLLIRHYKKLSTRKLGIYLILVYGLWMSMNYGWEYQERQFDVRVFGYYTGYKKASEANQLRTPLTDLESKLQNTIKR